MEQIDSALAVVGLSAEAPGEPGELMDVTVTAAACGARGEQILEALLEGSQPESCERVERFRQTMPFERLRAASDRWSMVNGRRPRVFLLALEAPAGAASPDRGFIRRLLAAGGLDAVDGGVFADPEGALAAFTEIGAEAAGILAAADGQISELSTELRLRGAVAVYLAGEDRQELTSDSVDGFIHDGCDVVTLAWRCLDRLDSQRRGD